MFFIDGAIIFYIKKISLSILEKIKHSFEIYPEGAMLCRWVGV